MNTRARSMSRRGWFARPGLEWLEGRTLLAGHTLATATLLSFSPLHTARVSGFLSAPSQADLYRVHLNAGDWVRVAVEAQASGSGLQSLLRVFTDRGEQVALNNQEGGDPQLAFQAPQQGSYFVGVSSAGNSAYDPARADSGAGGTTIGLYTLDLKREMGQPLTADLTGSSFRLGVDMAAAQDAVPVSFIVDNRGAADPGNFRVELRLGESAFLDDSSVLLRTLTRADLTTDATARQFSSPVGLTVTLPAGLSSEPSFVGLRIIADPTVGDANLLNNSGVHRGLDSEPLTVVTRVPAGVTDLSLVDANLRTGADGTLLTSNQVDTFVFTVPRRLSTGRLTAVAATTSGTLIPRLSLLGPNGQLLIQTNSGRIEQHLRPGTYALAVSAQAGVGSYRLSTEFTQASQPFARLAVGNRPYPLAAADVNGDGNPDLIAPNVDDDNVSVLLGNGDGSFQDQQTFGTGAGPEFVKVADVNGDGKLDVITANYNDASVSVLLGNGDGTFGAQQTFAVGTSPLWVTVADVNGDGKTDLIVASIVGASVSVLLGNGDGSFRPQQTFGPSTGAASVVARDVNDDGRVDLIIANTSDPRVSVLLGNGDGSFQDQQTFVTGAFAGVEVADVNNDGKLDLISSNFTEANVGVLLGNGDGSFRPQQIFAVGGDPYLVAVGDVNNDGKLDLVTPNKRDNTVSVLLGNGDGTFDPQLVFAVGDAPDGVVVVDLNADGKPDLVTADRFSNSLSVLLGNGDGTFQDRPQAVAGGPLPFAVAVADLNGDARLDVVIGNKDDFNVSVLLRNGDGSFQTQQTFPTGDAPQWVTIADVNGDGKPDLLVANNLDPSVSLLLGNGDGTFQDRRILPTGQGPTWIEVADLNGDDRPDLAVSNGSDNVSVLLGNGDGSFQSQRTFAAGASPYQVAVADINGDGKPDLVVSNGADATISLLFGNGDGSFQPQQTLATGNGPEAIVVDVNGDGNPDIVCANYLDNTVNILLGNGDGTFQARQDFATGTAPYWVVAGDVNNDSRLDLVTPNFQDNTVSVLLGNGDGTFAAQQVFATGLGPNAVAVGDINNDGNADLTVANRRGDPLSILLGNGDGTFQTQQFFAPGKKLYSSAVADVNGDGRTDLVRSNLHRDTVDVLLGDDTGSFQQGLSLSVGNEPTSVAAADLNRDGRADLVTTNSDSNTVSVRLGNGDGSFGHEQTLAVGRSPRAAVAADVNGDGKPDLVVANYNDGTVSVLLGTGDGSFAPQRTFRVGYRPYSLAVADVNSDGKPDLTVANAADGTVSVLAGNGDGTFHSQQTFATGRQPFSVAVADVNGDGRPDLTTSNFADDSISVLLGNGDSSFRPQQTFATGRQPFSVAVADVNGDGKPDLTTSNFADGTISVLLGNGDGSFQTQLTRQTQESPVQTTVADVNGDGRPDLLTMSNYGNGVGVLLGVGNGSFNQITLGGGAPRHTPHLVDLDGDSISDSVILDATGNILFRKGLPGSVPVFAPPVILNSKAALHTSQDRLARDLAVIWIGNTWVVAAADARFDPALSSANHFVFSVSLYTLAADDTVTRTTAFSTTALPTRLRAADLNADGLDDLIAVSALDNSATIAMQTAPGRFAAPLSRPVGVAPSDIAAGDVNADGLVDIVISDQASGDVSVLLNDPTHSFATALRFRSGIALYNIDTTAADVQVASRLESVALAIGDFTSQQRSDLVVVNQGAHSFSVLPGDGRGGFLDPQLTLTISTSDPDRINARPGAVVAADFDRAGQTDLAILMEDRGEVWIYTNQGDGTFAHTFSAIVGPSATGLTLVPGSGPGLLDLLVGNEFGDVLRLVGKGDGTFQPPPPFTGNRATLDVQDLLGNGQPDVLVANQQANRVTVQRGNAAGEFIAVGTVTAASQSTPFAPGNVEWSQLEGPSGPFYAVVLGTGSNSVMVSRLDGFTPSGQPLFTSPSSYAVGSNPVNATIADLNSDGILDMLVANQGSNDVSVLFGGLDEAGNWIAQNGPRLSSGGTGPIATMLRDSNSDSILDLVVTNAQSGTLTMLTGRGQGFFDDRTPQFTFLSDDIAGPPVISGSIGVLPTRDGRLVGFDLAAFASAGTLFISTGQGINAVGALSDGRLVVALQGGSVELLERTATGLFEISEVLTAFTGIPSEPSALEVLETDSGFRVLVTNAGDDHLFIFDLPSGEGVELPELPPPSPVAPDARPLTGAPLIVVITLPAGSLTDQDESERGATTEGDDIVGEELESTAAVGGEQETEEEEEPEAQPAPSALSPEEALQDLSLYTPTEEEPREPDVPAREQPEKQDDPVELPGDGEPLSHLAPALGDEEAGKVFTQAVRLLSDKEPLLTPCNLDCEADVSTPTPELATVWLEEIKESSSLTGRLLGMLTLLGLAGWRGYAYFGPTILGRKKKKA